VVRGGGYNKQTETPYYEQKMFDPYKVLDPEKNDLSSEGYLTKQLFFAVFDTLT
jgi:hypothetical protein